MTGDISGWWIKPGWQWGHPGVCPGCGRCSHCGQGGYTYNRPYITWGAESEPGRWTTITTSGSNEGMTNPYGGVEPK
jgi:hypothetical protein